MKKSILSIKPFPNRLGALEAQLAKAGLSREAFCNEAGIRSSLWTRWRAGRRPMLDTWETVRTTAVRLLGYDPDL